VRHDYQTFAAAELPIRSEHGYPPYTGMIRLIVRGDQERLAEQFAASAVEMLRAAAAAAATGLEARILGPAPCPIARLRNKFRFHALLSSTTPDDLRHVVRQVMAECQTPPEIQWVVDVDAIDLL
jgi:primosomal protein N' (replication factor Y)